MKIIFRFHKHNRYSLIPLIAAIHDKFPSIEMAFVGSLNEIMNISPPAVVAYSFMSFDVDWVSQEVNILKKKGYALIAGGPHATAKPEDVIRMGFDHVFKGDGEENILLFLKGERSTVFDGLVKRINIDEYPPFCSDLDLFMPIEITRGCPFGCAYCEVSLIGGKKPRHRSVESIVHHCKSGINKSRYIARFITPNAFGYGSDGMKVNVEAIDNLLYNLKKVGMKEIYFGSFPSDVRPEFVTDEVLKTIKKYVNNRYIILGAQSGSDRVLRLIKRFHTVEHVVRSAEIVLNNGFVPRVDIIFGFPFENEDDLAKTFDLIKKLVKMGCKIHAHTFMPLPGTELESSGHAALPEWVRRELSRFAQEGNLDGYWEKQLFLSKYLSEL